MKDFSSWKEELKSNNDIVAVIQKYLPLQKKGKTWWGRCPFHFEKTPSFAVDEMGQYYHCFGCGATGDVITFVQNIENCDFYEACRILAENCGMKMPEESFDKNIVEKKKQKDEIYAILKDTANYYYSNLKLPQAKVALDYYTQKRQLKPETIRTFGLGYSLGWNDVINYLKRKGYSQKLMLDAGIVAEKNGKVYDAYAGRLVFPLVNGYGDVVGFSARTLEANPTFAKYVNTRDTIVFDKSKCVYGINLLRKEKKENDVTEIIVVEGQVDVISVYQQGVHNVVACLGTAITPSHAKELKKVCNKVVLCLDGDSAGIKAAIRAIDVFVPEGLEVFVSKLPNKMDPDEYVKAYGVDKFREQIKNGKYWVEYLIDHYATQYDLSKTEEKNKFVKTAMTVIKKLETTSEQYLYLEKVKDKTNISMDVLKADLQGIEYKAPAEKEVILETNQQNAYIKAVNFVLASLLNRKEYARRSKMIRESLRNSDHVKLYDYIDNCYETGKLPIVSSVFDMFDVDNNVPIKSIINQTFQSGQENNEYYDDCVRTICQSGLAMRQKEITQKIMATQDIEERKKLAVELNEVSLKIKNVNKEVVYDR